MRRLWTWLLGGLAAAGTQVLADGPPITQLPSTEWIPFALEGRVMLVQARVNDAGPFPLILDTGATETVLTPPTALKAGVQGRGAAAARQTGVAGRVQLGGVTVKDLPVYIFDPPQALPLRLDQGANYGGILGVTFLRRFVTTLDYAGRRVRFQAVEQFPPLSGAAPSPGVVIPFTTDLGLIHVKGSVNGLGPLRLVVDTGSAEILIVPAAARRLGLKVIPHEQDRTVGFTRLKSLALGTACVTNVPAVVTSLLRETGGSLVYDGLVGYPFLSRFVVTINYRDQQLSLDEPGRARP